MDSEVFETFGPIRPALSYRTMEEAIARIQSTVYPLAFYPINEYARSNERRVRLPAASQSTKR